MAPILERLSVHGQMWVARVKSFGLWFHHAAGRVEHLMQAVPTAGRHWFQYLARSRAAFG